MKRLLSMALVAAIGLSAHEGLAWQSAHDLFQKALSKERVDGQLTEAIALYERVVKESSGDRGLAVKALVQMAQCYERLGKSDAQTTYNRIIREYPDQQAAVNEARQRLAALARPVAPAGVATRRVWAGRDVDIQGRVSPDGRYLSYADTATGDLAVRDLQTSQNVRLTTGDAGQVGVEFAQASVFARDSRQIAYAWFNKDQIWELRTTRVGQPRTRVIYRNAEFPYLEPFDWTPDGRFVLAALQRPDGTASVAAISAGDGTMRVLKSIDWHWPSGLRLSPDGRHLVYALPPKDGVVNKDVYLLAIDGSRETKLVEHAADDTYPEWTPDGTGVLFLSDRSGSVDVWHARVSDGRPNGAPVLVKRDFGRGLPLGVTRDGSLYAAMQTQSLDVYLGEVDLSAGRATAAVRPLSQRFVGTNYAPDWSRDGTKLAYQSRRGVGGPGTSALVIHTLADGIDRELVPAVQYFHRPRWMPDGTGISVEGRGLRSTYGIFRVDATSGATERIGGTAAKAFGAHAVWSPDGHTLFYASHAPKEDAIVALNVTSGQARDVLRVESGPIAASPDGEVLAFRWGDAAGKISSIRLVATAGGEARDVMTLRSPEAISFFGGLSWTPDGKRILFVKQLAGNAPRELWQVDVATGQASSLAMSAIGLQYVRLHPDGRRLAYSAGTREAEIWVIERLLPAGSPIMNPSLPKSR